MHGKRHSLETIQKMKKPKLNKESYQTDSFKEKMRAVQSKAASDRRSLTKEQYDKIYEYLAEGHSKKEIATILSISYDIVKKWSCRKW
jgi:DNA-binding NarL/FixJ family response regulator